MVGRSQRHLREIQGYDSSGTAEDGRSIDAPRSLTVPTIAGTAQVGQVLTGTNGTFSGNPAPTIARQWLANGAAISGATGATYTPVVGDIGKVISLRNTGSNDYGSEVSVSAPTTAVIAAA